MNNSRLYFRIVTNFGVGLLFLLLFAVSASAAAPAERDNIQYFAILLDSHKIGYGTHQRTEKDNRVITTESYDMSVKRAGTPIRFTSFEKDVETESGKPVAFDASQKFSFMEMTVAGAAAEDGNFNVVIKSAGNEQRQSLAWPPDALLAEGLRLVIRQNGFAENTTYKTKVFLPTYLLACDAAVRVGPTAPVDLLGRVVPLTEITIVLTLPSKPSDQKVQNVPAEIPSVMYVNTDCDILKSVQTVADMKVELIACDRAFALSQDDIPDFIDKMIIACPVPLTDAADAKSITYHLVSKEGKAIKVDSDDNQLVKPDGSGGLFLTVSPVKPTPGQFFPYRGNDPAAIESLKPTQYLQSDAEPVRKLALQAVGDTTDASQAAQKIRSFVHDYITKKDFNVGYASALEIIQSRQGDCTEHAVLTAALCRAVGLPARVAFGYIYVDNFDGHSHVFGGHAWAQVFIDGRWYSLDATVAQDDFTPTHILLTTGNGDPQDFFDKMILQNRFQIADVQINR